MEIELAVNSSPHRHSRRKKKDGGLQGVSLPTISCNWALHSFGPLTEGIIVKVQTCRLEVSGLVSLPVKMKNGEKKRSGFRGKKSTSRSFWVKTVKQNKDIVDLSPFKSDHTDKNLLGFKSTLAYDGLKG